MNDTFGSAGNPPLSAAAVKARRTFNVDGHGFVHEKSAAQSMSLNPCGQAFILIGQANSFHAFSECDQ